MSETNVFKLSQPGRFSDPLTEVLRSGARFLLAQAVEAEVAAMRVFGLPNGLLERRAGFPQSIVAAAIGRRLVTKTQAPRSRTAREFQGQPPLGDVNERDIALVDHGARPIIFAAAERWSSRSGALPARALARSSNLATPRNPPPWLATDSRRFLARACLTL